VARPKRINKRSYQHLLRSEDEIWSMIYFSIFCGPKKLSERKYFT